MKSINYLESVREQYEDYPYPLRKPDSEKRRLLYTQIDALDCINYYCFSGRRNLYDNCRFLVAGGGTGDSLMLLAEQLRDGSSELVYLDICKASMDIAKQRAEVRRLNNIKWVHGSLLDLPDLGLGNFDYINCSGVLHHLSKPEDGLEALCSVLKDDGVMGIMVYGKYGRNSIYQLQDLMKIINSNETSIQQKIDNSKVILQNLPETNVFKEKQFDYGDIVRFGDAGIYDLLLHSQDIAYSVPELYDFLSSSGLQLVHFLFSSHPEGNNLYNLRHYVTDSPLVKDIASLTKEEQHTAAELLHGGIIKHIFYTAKNSRYVPNVDDLSMVPFFNIFVLPSVYKELYDELSKVAIGATTSVTMDHMTIVLTRNRYTTDIVKHLDGNRTLHEIFDRVLLDYRNSDDEVSLTDLCKDFERLYISLNKYDWMLLRSPTVSKSKTLQQMQRRVSCLYTNVKHGE